MHLKSQLSKEVSVEEALTLWLGLLNYKILGYEVSSEALEDVSPPFGNVKREDYTKAMKVYEELKTQIGDINDV